MQNQSNSLITFDTQLKTALITSLPVHFVHKSDNTSLRHPRNLHRHFFLGGGGGGGNRGVLWDCASSEFFGEYLGP